MERDCSCFAIRGGWRFNSASVRSPFFRAKTTYLPAAPVDLHGAGHRGTRGSTPPSPLGLSGERRSDTEIDRCGRTSRGTDVKVPFHATAHNASSQGVIV